MKKLAKKTYQLLSTRVSIRVVAYATCLLVVALFLMFHFSRKAIRLETVSKAELVLEGTIQNIDNTIHIVETATNNMLWNVEHNLDRQDLMPYYCQRILESNPSIIGCAIAFEPYFYKQKDSLYMAYALRPDAKTWPESITFADSYGIGPYTQQPWYALAKERNRPYWIEPVIDNNYEYDDIITYSVPVRDHHGNFVGILGSDIDLDWLSNTILASKPFPNSYCTLIGKNGKYIIHPDTTRLFHQTIYEFGAQQLDPSVSECISKIMNGEEGFMPVKLDGKEYMVFFKPYPSTGWSAAIVCSESDIFGAYKRMWLYMVIICIVGLSGLLIVCFLSTRHQLRPLYRLARLLQFISEGNYNEPIAKSTRKDEIGHLQNSFQKMQQSLSDYIEEADKLAETLKERNETLRLAYQQAMEADRVKTAFLHNVTDQIVPPIERITTNADTLRIHYCDLSQEEIEKNVDSIKQDTDFVTNLLNQLLDVALRSET